MQGVGCAHITEEAGNDGGGKGRTYKPFLVIEMYALPIYLEEKP